MEIDGSVTSPSTSHPDDLQQRHGSHSSTSTPASSPDGDQMHNQPPDDFNTANYYQASVSSSSSSSTAAATAASSATRRHTVGPGDVTYEQSLSSHPQGHPINFKFGDQQSADAYYLQQQHLLPINLPMLQNQPLHNFSMKNHHLLKPPMVMENSSWRQIYAFNFVIY